MSRLEGKVCVVTGAASGIGLETVRAFRREGAQVAALDRSEVVREIDAELALICDVAREQDVATAFATAAAELGPIEALVNAAGVALEARVEQTTLEQWNHVLAVNLTGSFLCAKHAILRAAERLSLVFISSMSALVATADEPAYCASKAGVIGLARSIAVDHAASGVRANCICPGVIDTPMNDPMWAERGAAFRAEVTAAHPVGRLGEARDVAALALYLASDESGFVTGTQLVLDGGYTAR